MKRILLFLCLLGFIDAEEENPKNGLFFGLEVGLQTAALNHAFENGAWKGFVEHPAGEFGIKFGDQLYYTNNFGAKLSLYGGISTPITQGFALGDARAKIDLLPLSFGVDFEFLYDFLQKGNFLLGVNFGAGYRFVYYRNRETSVQNGFKNSFKSNDFYPQIGLHFFLGRHQIFINYRAGGLLYQNSKILRGIIKNTMPLYARLRTSDYIAMEYLYRF
ncbi:hypothetical protein [Helicobacter mustelae]|uniref:hypothetical protein n=1 Tax=Helicobacter mustelae TaxID=217 RepID=UPI0003249C40|nr:hypothetical protein [Helicobacter mustelae]SQH72169.1 membrane protein [Helicobacter mustelae]STP13314.1 membrane protein [Helicobacter mustelae]